MKKILLILLAGTITFADQLFTPLPQNIEYNKQKATLGQKLFFDPILSKNKDISCFSCHSNYGTDNLAVSIGTNGEKGETNSLSIFNLPFKIAYFWDGRSQTLQEQMINGPLYNSHEMASDKETIEKRLKQSQEYVQLFQKIFNKKPSLELTLDALTEYQKSLISINSRFDKFLRNEIKLTEKEKKGMGLFIEYGCVSCHNGINVGGNSYQQLGSVIGFKKMELKSENNSLVFVVPSLRNVAMTYPYFHDGSVKSLQEAIKQMAYHNVGVKLTDNEIQAIESFLKTLTGEIPKNFKKVTQ